MSPIRYRSRHWLFLAAALALAAGPGAVRAGPPEVTVTIGPLHSLVAGVMAGAGEPHLVVRGQGSPHTYRMRPSDARALAHADLVVWVGEGLETFLAGSLATLAGSADVVEAGTLAGLVSWPAREGGLHEGHGAAHEHGNADPHVWLDPRNAAVIAGAVANRLAALDPARASLYARNARALQARLAALDRALAARLAPLRDRPYVVLHDAYQYLERRYLLHSLGAVTVSPDRMPGARRIGELRRQVRATGARCLFAEPQVSAALLETVAEGEVVRIGVLDPLGARYTPGPEAYFEMMEANAAALEACLAG